MSIDPETHQRSIKTSGHFYSEIIQSQGVTTELYEKYVMKQEYDVR